MFICKICGYNKLETPQYTEESNPNFVICPCCGFESGYDDLDQGFTIEEYRKKWFREGCDWLNKEKKPKEWDIEKQLRNINCFYNCE
ncbi:MAG TPA: hypothetical protein DEP72_01030 [Clostridiales bacterium]|nr:hypothetical protein [Clostridiales bacterium]